MNGLLDFIKTPEGQGLLSAAFGGLAGARRGTPLNNIGRAGIAGLTGYGSAQDRITQEAEAAQARELRAMQTAKYKRDMTADETAAAEKQRVEDLIRTTFLPVTGTNANVRTGITGPRPEAAEAIGTQPAVNYQQLIAMGVPFERVKQLAESQNLGRTKVARTVKGMGEDGREFEYQVDDYGQRVGDGLAQYRAPIQVNQGDRQTFVDPYKLTPVGQFGINETPDGRAGRAVTMRGQNMTDSRARERMAFDASSASSANLGKAPTGYRWAADGASLEPIPGGPAGKADNATEGERRASTLMQRMNGSLQQLQAVTKKNPGAATPSVLAESARKLPLIGGDTPANILTSSDRQRVEAAQLDILDAALTLGTGAAYTKEQLEGYRRSYFPQLGDSTATVKDKEDRLNTVLRAARTAAGRAAPAQGAAQQQPTPSNGFRIIEVN